jgi:hypothetical protein
MGGLMLLLDELDPVRQVPVGTDLMVSVTDTNQVLF